jgi:hypothetical protein
MPVRFYMQVTFLSRCTNCTARLKGILLLIFCHQLQLLSYLKIFESFLNASKFGPDDLYSGVEDAKNSNINWVFPRMSSQGGSKKSSSTQAAHSDQSDCSIEAAKLLNCVASKKYSKEECIALLDSLRACVKKHVRFWHREIF